MRVLCPVAGSRSHAIAMLPVTRALAQAGHEVLVVAPTALFPVFENEPVQIREGLVDLIKNSSALAMGAMRRLTPNTTRREFELIASLEVLSGPHITANYRELLPLARDFEADLILRDGFELTGCLVAETLGIPHVSAPSGAIQQHDPVLVLAGLNERRREVGLPTSEDPNSIFPYGRLDAMPPRYSFAHYPLPGAFAYCQPAVIDRTERLPEWLTELPTDRPLVMASIGEAVISTVKALTPELIARTPPQWMASFNPLATLQAFVDGLSQLNCVAVVATGGLPMAEAKGDNVHVVDHFPQVRLLECAELFVTHGGYNGIREATRAGVPMAVAPQLGDQFLNADRIQELGLGVKFEQHDADLVTRTCRDLLQDGSQVRAEMRRAQRHMLALPPVEAAVAHLETLVGDRVA